AMKLCSAIYEDGVLSREKLGHVLIAHAAEVQAYGKKSLSRHHAAQITVEDIIQEVWITAFRSFDHSGVRHTEELSNWLKSLANRKLLDAIKAAMSTKRGGAIRLLQAGSDERRDAMSGRRARSL